MENQIHSPFSLACAPPFPSLPSPIHSSYFLQESWFVLTLILLLKEIDGKNWSLVPSLLLWKQELKLGFDVGGELDFGAQVECMLLRIIM